MDRRWRHLFAFVWVFAALALHNARADNADAVKAVEGLWAYTSLKASGTGQVMPLTGVILYKDGFFAQQSIFDGEPFDTQGAMAHAGPFGAGPKGVHMTAEQTISSAGRARGFRIAHGWFLLLTPPASVVGMCFVRDVRHDTARAARISDNYKLLAGASASSELRYGAT